MELCTHKKQVPGRLSRKEMMRKLRALAVIVTSVGLSALPVFAAEHAQQHTKYVPVKTGSYKDYVVHTPTKKWPQRQVQVRVSHHRKLPHPISDQHHGDLLHTTDFFPDGCSSGALVPSRFTERDGYKMWQFTNTVDADDIKGLKSFGIEVEFPHEKKLEGPLEIFHYPPLTDAEPDQWTQWVKAGSKHGGEMGWWSEVHKNKAEEQLLVEHPFEIRWRFVLKDDPVRIIDDGIVDDEASSPDTLRQ